MRTVVFFGLIACYTTWGSATNAQTVESFRSDSELARRAIVEQASAEKSIASTTSLLKWNGYPDFLDLTIAITEVYGSRTSQDLGFLRKNREPSVSSRGNPADWLDTALLATAMNDPRYAVHCFEEAMKNPTLSGNPFVHGLKGRALLSQDMVSAATAEYTIALNMAKSLNDDAVLFRVRNMYADDLFSHNLIDAAIPIVASQCLTSKYPLEHAWALGQQVQYAWSRNDQATLKSAFEELKGLLPSVVPREDLDWQQRRYKELLSISGMIEKALSTDPAQQMAADVEALDYEYKTAGFKAGLARMEPWIKKYPLEEYNTWEDRSLRKWSVWAHYNYYAVLSILGRSKEAEDGFWGLIANVPFNDAPDRVVEAFCWLGRIRIDQHNYGEAKDFLEKGLILDDPTSALTPPEIGWAAPLDLPSFVQGGYLPPSQRTEFIKLYRFTLDALIAK